MSTLSASVPSQVTAAAAAPAGGARRRFGRLLRHGLSLTAIGYLAVLIVASAGASWLAPMDPERQELASALAGPGAGHWLGTDRLGRDVLSRLMHGGQVTLVSVLEAVLVFAVLGTGLGVAAGYLGGRVDRAISWLSDLLLALPGIIMLLMVLSVFPGNTAATMVVLGIISAPMLLRVTRGVTIGVRQELYVRAARLSGLTEARIMVRHVLPRLAGPITVQVFLFAATAVLVQGALSFLGLSAPETQGPSWGNMVAQAAEVISVDLWLAIPTGGALVLTVLALGLVGDAVRDATTDHHPVALVPGTPRRRGLRLAQKVADLPAQKGASQEALRLVQKVAELPAQKGASQEALRLAPAVADAVERDPAAAPLLRVRGLTIEFPRPDGDVTVVRDVSFDVAAGECVGLIGESGSGKTMIARSLLGLLPPGGEVSAGTAEFDGRDLVRLREREFARIRGRRIALVSQEPQSSLDPSFRVDSQLTEVIRRHHPMSRRDARKRALSLLETVRLPEPEQVARRYPHELSGGMAQRVAIALALAGEPSLLIADEPTTALDVTVQAEILGLLRDLQGRLGMAVILVTHDWGVLADLCDRAVVVYAGEVVEQASVVDLYHDARHPYTRSLLAANPHLAPISRPLPTIPGSVAPPSSWPPGCRFRPRCSYAIDACAVGMIPLVGTSAGRLSRCIRSDELAKR